MCDIANGIAVNIEVRGRIRRDRNTISIDGLHRDVVNYIDRRVDRGMMWREAHGAVDSCPIICRCPLCPSNPKLSPLYPHFNANPDGDASRVGEVTVTIRSQFGRSLIIHSDFHDYIWIRDCVSAHAGGGLGIARGRIRYDTSGRLTVPAYKRTSVIVNVE